MKKYLIFSLTVLLVGCATNQQTGALAGAAVGAATGKVLAGDAGMTLGTVLGAAVGSNVGENLDRLNNQIVQVHPSQIYYGVPPNIVYIRPYYRAPGANWIWVYTSHYGWGWYHRHHGFYPHSRYRR